MTAPQVEREGSETRLTIVVSTITGRWPSYKTGDYTPPKNSGQKHQLEKVINQVAEE